MRKDLEIPGTRYTVLALALLVTAGASVATAQSASERSVAATAERLGTARLPQAAFGDASGEPQGFGTKDLSITTVPALLPAFDQSSGQHVEYSTDLDGWMWKSGGTANFHDFVAPVSLPTGASLESVAIEACDDHSPGAVILSLNGCPLRGDCTALGSVSTGSAETPGCDIFSFDLSDPVTIRNALFRLNLLVTDTRNTSETQFRQVLLMWRRQISPAPGTATFDDVPTGHLFFQHIEALASSGITSGCGGDDFCPDDPLTRGQMAVFLAKALGLHWPF